MTQDQDQIIDEEYASEEDSDFAPDAASLRGDGGSDAPESEDDEVQLVTAPNKKRAADANADDDFENSGDEVIIQRGKKRQKKDKQKDASAEDDDDGGRGLIKTRSMRAVEKAEKKLRTATGPVTIDVDDLWAKMTAVPLLSSNANEEAEAEKENQRPTQDSTDGLLKGARDKLQQNFEGGGDSLSMIKIKRTYNFAGKVHTEEKLVPRDSAEAKLYLASQDPKTAEDVEAEDGQPRRKPRRAFRSIFEPVVEGLAQREDLNLGMDARLQLREQAKAKKLNVVEKSRMDWAGFVDKEGIKDELELAGKSKQSYVNRQDFLDRVTANKDEEARRARIAGRA
ncbi:BCNT-domain-containing protein [Annulohypoxylon maeteangense]|uniref:BCNT-domain-containing protein n=1 Tax=Annulohypoxylon maeteangense TaxID=1927788 RepID=UPI0020088F6E|nr:BCNT-domain-containing protein [Annulohypoxylon maeteangense]KAI0883631.1 BCNT-domain-containing protein [Annulohypoxylon maeteangense]